MGEHLYSFVSGSISGSSSSGLDIYRRNSSWGRDDRRSYPVSRTDVEGQRGSGEDRRVPRDSFMGVCVVPGRETDPGDGLSSSVFFLVRVSHGTESKGPTYPPTLLPDPDPTRCPTEEGPRSSLGSSSSSCHSVVLCLSGLVGGPCVGVLLKFCPLSVLECSLLFYSDK